MSQPASAPAAPDPAASGGPAVALNPLPVLVTAVLVVMAAQQAMIPVLAPLARDLGLPDFSLGLLMTGSAGMFALTSPRWGRAVDRVGHRRVLLSGLALCFVGTLGFAVACELAVRGVVAPEPALGIMIATRALLFGTGMGAVPVASMAWVAANTTTTAERVRGLSRIGAVQGLAMAIGPALGGLLAFAGFLGPVWLAPALVAGIWAVAAWKLPQRPARTAEEAARDAAPVPRSQRLRPWDHRLWPVMLAGLSTFLTMGLVVMCLGFVVQDRLGLEGAATARTTGLVSTLTGTVMVATQGFVVPRLAWPPWRLLRTGIPIVAVAVLGMVLAQDLWSITLAMCCLALGMGFAGPGYTSAPTLLVGPSEQGQVAGLVQGVTGLTFVFGPLVGTTLYGVRPELPYLLGASICTLAAVFVWLRSAGAAETVPVGGEAVADPADPGGPAVSGEPTAPVTR